MNIYLNYSILIIILGFIEYAWMYSNFKLYKSSTEKIQKLPFEVNYYSATLAYIIVIFSILFIAIPFTLQHISKNEETSQKLYKSFIYGGAVGFSIYSLYNLTSMSVYKNYDIKVAIIDTAWGTFLYTFLTFIFIMNMNVNIKI